MRLQTGTLLHGDTYKIEKVLGQGSFGITYLAVHTVLERKVCIKEFFMKEINTRNVDGSITGMTDGSLSYNYGQKFKKEALNLSRLDHPNIVRVTDSFEENGTYYYVMDYIDGDNLNEYLKDHEVTQKEALSIIRDVATALMYMHEEKKMLHLDLKPGNIMRRHGDGHIFLIDFGLSKHYSSDGQPETSTSIGLGTAGYAPIEQANQMKSGEFRPTIDVYALGATLFKLLTRETPPPASEIVSDDEFVESKLRANGITGPIIDVVVNAMMPNVKKRTQTIRDFLYELPSTIEEKSITSDQKNISDFPSEETVVTKSDSISDQSLKENVSFEQSYVSHDDNLNDAKNKGSNFKIAVAVIVAVIIGVCVCFILTPSNGERFFEAESLMEGKTVKDGKFIPADEVAALTVMQELANKGYGPALYTMGVYYANGLASIKADSIEADNYFKKAVPVLTKEAESGDKYSQCALAILYGNGLGVKEDPKMSFYWMEKSAEQGYDDAQENLALMYNLGEGVATDNKKALYWLKKASEQNHPDAMMTVALFYNVGIGVDIDSLEANKIYAKLDGMEYAPAQNCLGNYYYNKGEYSKAISLFKKAADKDNWPAQLQLCHAYLLGNGVKEDSNIAQEWAMKAVDNSDHKDAEAIWVLGICYERNDVLNMAFKCFEESANMGDANAQYKLAVYYQQGLGGVKVNRQIAEKWYKKAIANGYQE